ncbi:MAG: LytTR family DNA-binding domain-containing protein [Velocimicrobium sp.]
MKISIEEIVRSKEEEIVIRCYEVNEEILQLIQEIKQKRGTLIGMDGDKIHKILLKEVYYFESVDNRTFIYGKEKVFESKQKLYELEAKCAGNHFFRASKSLIINASKIECIRPVLSGRFEAQLRNGESLMVSRQFVPVLKKLLGI